MHKLTTLVEHHPQFNSKLEKMLEEIFNKLEPEVSAAIRKEKNEDSCSMYCLSNDTLGHILGYVGEKNYLFVACVSNRFHQVYVETFGVETLTSIGKSAVLSVSCAKLCLDSTNIPDRSPYAKTKELHGMESWKY